MIRVGINGFGRIGRAIYRCNLEQQAFEVVVVNDINPDNGNLAYTLNYDTTYGPLRAPFTHDAQSLYNDRHRLLVTHEQRVDQVDWAAHGVDYLIDATGVAANWQALRRTVAEQDLAVAFVTQASNDVDYTLVLGANDDGFDPTEHRVVSSSICDATAIAPVMKRILSAFGIESGMVTTVHPWLSYQNLSDGAASSWSVPGTIHHHYALGRSSIGTLIPKPTSAVEVTCRSLPELSPDRIGSFSYRVPTPVVGSADLTLLCQRDITRRETLDQFEQMAAQQRWPIVHNNFEPLISADFQQNRHSAVVDHRFTEIAGRRLLKLVLWYDNEWGYASRVVDHVAFADALRTTRAPQDERGRSRRPLPAPSAPTRFA